MTRGPRGPIHPLDHPLGPDHGANMKKMAFLNSCDFLQNFIVHSDFDWCWILLNTPFNLWLRLLIPDHKVSINIRRKNVWNLLLTTLVYGSRWEHMGASTGNQGFSMLTPVFFRFFGRILVAQSLEPGHGHMARQRQRNWMYRKERCRQCAADVEIFVEVFWM